MDAARVTAATGDSERLRDRKRTEQPLEGTKPPTGSKPAKKTSQRAQTPTGSEADKTNGNTKNL